MAPTEIDFGGVYLNTRVSLPLTVKNTGFGNVTGQLVNIAAPFSLQGPSGYVLAPLESVDLTIIIELTGRGSFSNVITLTGTGGLDVLLKGYALPTLQLMPVALAFPDTRVGYYNEAIVVSQNIGDGILTGRVDSLSSPYTVTGNANFTLSSMEWTFHTVRFDPAVTGTFTNTLVFSGGGGARLPITGVGIPVTAPDIIGVHAIAPDQLQLEWVDSPDMIYKVWWTDDLFFWPPNQYVETTGSIWVDTNTNVRLRYYRLSGQ